MPDCNLLAYNKENCAFFALGRNAMYAGCLAMGIGPGDEVLTPAFDCDGSLQPFRALGLNIKFYRSDPYTFSAELDDIRKNITAGTKLLHVINHFGFPQPWNEILKISGEAGIPVLEDNAYSLFSNLNERPFGAFGDVATFSLRKNLLVPDGGMLRINNPKYRLIAPGKKPAWCYRSEYKELFRILWRSMGHNQFVKTVLNDLFATDGVLPPLYSDKVKGYPDLPMRDRIGAEFQCDYTRPMSAFSGQRLKAYSTKDFNLISERKISSYIWLVKRLEGLKNVKILWPELPSGAVPFALSVLVERDRDKALSQLRKKYDAMAWPTLPMAVIERLGDFPEVELLGRKILQIDLPADRVIKDDFTDYLEGLARDLSNITG